MQLYISDLKFSSQNFKPSEYLNYLKKANLLVPIFQKDIVLSESESNSHDTQFTSQVEKVRCVVGAVKHYLPWVKVRTFHNLEII